MPVGAGGGSNSSNDTYLQCDLPPRLLPVSLAAATFMRFPPGTRILYHPPGVNRTVPFAASRAGRADGTCRVARNAVVADDDAGHNMSRSDVDRGHIGYYTVFLPPSCASVGASGVANATLLILGDFAGCPFWSADASSHIGPRLA